MPEGAAAAAELPGGGLEGALGRMRAHLAAGRLPEAAAALEEGAAGTAAARAAAGWARDARARARRPDQGAAAGARLQPGRGPVGLMHVLAQPTWQRSSAEQRSSFLRASCSLSCRMPAVLAAT